jgi:hypothetical protein
VCPVRLTRYLRGKGVYTHFNVTSYGIVGNLGTHLESRSPELVVTIVRGIILQSERCPRPNPPELYKVESHDAHGGLWPQASGPFRGRRRERHTFTCLPRSRSPEGDRNRHCSTQHLYLQICILGAESRGWYLPQVLTDTYVRS